MARPEVARDSHDPFLKTRETGARVSSGIDEPGDAVLVSKHAMEIDGSDLLWDRPGSLEPYS